MLLLHVARTLTPAACSWQLSDRTDSELHTGHHLSLAKSPDFRPALQIVDAVCAMSSQGEEVDADTKLGLHGVVKVAFTAPGQGAAGRAHPAC